MTYEYLIRAPEGTWASGTIMDSLEYERQKLASIPPMLESLSAEGWEVCGIIPGNSVTDYQFLLRRPKST